MNTYRALSLSLSIVAALSVVVTIAAERRAPAPKFSSDSFRGVFFGKSTEAIRGSRPGMGAAQAAGQTPAVNARIPGTAASPGANASGFSALISPATLEDEIKRIRLELDTGVTTPAAFQSGGFQDARVQLSILASLFAIVTEHNGDVRWKKDAPAARDLIARTALNCKSGSGQVYNEVKQRKGDLEDLVSGTGLAARDAEPTNDWSVIADRVPLMTYLEKLLDGPLKEGTQNAAAVKAEAERIRRAAELVASVSEILTKPGLADAEDTDYAAFSKELTAAARGISLALDQGDPAGVSSAVGAVTQACDKCHEAYR